MIIRNEPAQVIHHLAVVPEGHFSFEHGEPNHTTIFLAATQSGPIPSANLRQSIKAECIARRPEVG